MFISNPALVFKVILLAVSSNVRIVLLDAVANTGPVEVSVVLDSIF